MKPLDLVLFGATGFTGRLTAEYLAEHARRSGLRWGIAGRDEAKLLHLRERLTPGESEIAVIVARGEDRTSLRAMTRRCRVLLTTAGPFAAHGEAVVGACLDEGTDYVDITGELPFWHDVVQRHHERAERNGVLLVPCCGFESAPIDLGVRFTLAQLPADEDVRIRGYVSARGRISGGTWSSAIQAMAHTRTWNRLARPPEDQSRLHYARAVDQWAMPLPSIDPSVVRRSLQLAGSPRKVEYEHYFALPNLAAVARWVGGIGLLTALSQTAPTRRWLMRRLPAGSGPSPEVRADGRFEVVFVAETARGARAQTVVRGHDPGYGHTSKMVAEAALALVEERDALPARGGVLTPAQAFGDILRTRFERTGMVFERVERTSP